MADKMNYGDCAVYPIPAVNRLLKETEETIKTDISGDISDLDSRLDTAESDISGLDSRLDTAETDIGTLETITATNNANVNLSESDVIAIEPVEGVSTWSNYAHWGNSYYYKKGTRVHIHLGLHDLTANGATDIAVLPEGYRPRTTFTGIGQGQLVSNYAIAAISPEGGIVVYGTTQYFIGDFEFDTFAPDASA